MTRLEWDNEKNEMLKHSRDVCFEDVERVVSEGGLLDIKPHFNNEKYPQQKILILRLNGYVHYVPFVLEGNVLFLKSIIPSRKLNKLYKD